MTISLPSGCAWYSNQPARSDLNRFFIPIFQLTRSVFCYFYYSLSYSLQVYVAGQEDNVLFQRRFCVYVDLVDIQASTTKPTASYGDFRRDQQVDIAIAPRLQCSHPRPRGCEALIMKGQKQKNVVFQVDSFIDCKRQISFHL